MVVYLIGNRVDQEDQREVQKQAAVDYCKANKIDKFFETSALTGFNVEDVFSLAAKELYNAKKEAESGSGGLSGGQSTKSSTPAGTSLE